MIEFLKRGITGIIMLAVIRASVAAIPPLNNAFVRYLGVSDELAPMISGTILALGYIFAVIGPLVAGRLSDRKGHAITFLTGGVVFGLFFLFWTYAPVYQILYIYRVILALASSAVYIGMQAFFLEGAPEGKKGMGMGFYGIGFGVGAAIGPMLASIVVPRFGIIQAYYVLAIASLVGTGIGFIGVQLSKRNKKAETSTQKTQEKEDKEKKESFLQIFMKQSTPVYLLILTGVLVGTNNAAVFANIDDLGVSLGWDVGRAIMGVAIFAALSLLQPLGGYLGDRLGKPQALLLGLIFLTIGFGGLAFINEPILIFPLMAIAGIGGILYPPNSQALMGSFAPVNLRGTLLGYLQSSTGLGSAVGAILGGVLHTIFTVSAPFFLALLAGIVGTISALYLFLKTPKEQR